MRKILVVLALLVVFPAVSWPGSANKVSDAGMRGPYDTGFTFFLLVDGSRDTGTLFGGRPIPAYVWYPVDPADVDEGTPRASYPLDPYYGILPSVSSLTLEAQGFDPAFQQPAPSANGPFPLVLFSPGWGALSMFHVSLATRLASHGFVVAVVTHFGDGTLPWDPLDHPAVASMNRPMDLSFVLNRLLDRNASQADLFYGLVEPEQVAAAGWSLGGYAALTLAGGDDLVCDSFYDASSVAQYGLPPAGTCVSSPPDPRIKAVVTLDGANRILRFAEMARITVPVLGIGQGFETVLDWQARQHAAIRSRPCYRVDLKDSIHWSFSDMYEAYQLLGALGLVTQGEVDAVLGAFSGAIAPAVAHELVSKYMVAFLKTHLEGETGYARLLTPGWAIHMEPDIEFFVTEKKSPNAIDVDWPDLSVYFWNQPGSDTARAIMRHEVVGRIPGVGFDDR